MKRKKNHLLLLCLALLGVAVLTSNPVKADEGVFESPRVLTEDHEYEEVSEVNEYEEVDQMSPERRRGFEDGLRDGENAESPNVNRNEILIPEDVKDQWNNADDSDYRDGYEQGYSKKWHDNHPIKSTLQWLWQWLVKWFI
ncbi:TPA: hypothetical protein ACJTRZ_001339 [Streptococcus pyogenes]|uniref:hypothetical protein n=1 Tax=Streptococcus pyogenes TaxID=1314 RepID=UPI00109CECE5|nr:hypothetical protein [Streptococcus pyogenes]VHM99483.1 Uncharacterised protein [Streptococcus pyogenes]HEP1432181.1 hypothetical protein [Streptococcus pyogenes]HEP2074421.1 hypothetical protein [Streptococcus pyogenes]HEQ8331095.1 hypothetical protein [Streptococcus pyogenes]HEQ9248182.1 hypothetical protein [Streptococcus pyogenes]